MASSAPVPSRRSDERTYHAQHALSDDETLSVSIVEAVAAIRGEDPTAVDFHLRDHVDPTALDAFYASSRVASDTTWTLELTIDEFDLTVQSDGKITIGSR